MNMTLLEFELRHAQINIMYVLIVYLKHNLLYSSYIKLL